MQSPIPQGRSAVSNSPLSQSRFSRFTPWLLLAGDLIVLMAFVFAGQREHELANPEHPIIGLLLTTAEFAVVWVVAGWLIGAFPREIVAPEVAPRSADAPQRRSYGTLLFLGRTLNTWLVTAPLGVLIRAFVLRRAIIPVTFLAVALGLGGALLIGWRLVFALIWARINRR